MGISDYKQTRLRLHLRFIYDINTTVQLTNHQVKHQAIYEVGSEPGDCKSPLNLPQEFEWVCKG